MALGKQSTIADEIAALNLPDKGQIVLFAGAAMEYYGVRQANDIDATVSYKNWVYLRDILCWPVKLKYGRRHMESPDGRFEVWRWWYDATRPSRRVYLPEILTHTICYEDLFYVIDHSYLIATKRLLGRPKDIADLALLEKA